MKKAAGLGFLLVSAALTLFFNGNFSSLGTGLTPLAQLFHPSEGIWHNGVSKNQTEHTLEVVVNQSSHTVVFDERRVPHAYSETLEELLFLQGYIEASERLFQMDFITKAAEGRLSEIFGERTVEIDKAQNRKDLERSARIACESWSRFPREMALLNHYIEGVNAYISGLEKKEYPLEYKLLNFSPEKWSLYKSALIFKYMSNTLARHEDDIESANMLALLGRETFDFIYPENEDTPYPVIMETQVFQSEDIVLPSTAVKDAYSEIIRYADYEKSHPSAGSNNWAVSGKKTATGHPILCNDPHLSLSLPSIWFEIQLTTPEFNAYGVSFPGVPGIMIGFNDDIAWGETNCGQDVTDLYVLDYTDETKSSYWLDGKAVPVELDIQEIKIKNKASVFDTMIYTFWGPVLSKSHDGRHDVVMHWLPSYPTEQPELMTFINTMMADNYDAFLEGTSLFNTPAQNFLFAAGNGEIGLRVNGLLPSKKPEDGRFLRKGNTSAAAWTTFIPRHMNPQSRNPESGYLTSSNQRSAGRDYPYYYTGYFEEVRNYSINTQLDTMFEIDLPRMQKLQTDSYSHLAAEMVPLLITHLDSNDADVQLLSKWNHRYDRNETAPVLYEELMGVLKRNIFDEIYAYSDSFQILPPRDRRMYEIIRDACASDVFDKLYTVKKENCTDIIRLSFAETIQKIKTDELAGMTWSEYKPVDIFHYTRLPAFSKTQIQTDGCPDAINAMNRTFGPSWRMTVALGDSLDAYGIYPGGQSGNPLHPNYDNMIAKWAENQYEKLDFWSIEKMKIETKTNRE